MCGCGSGECCHICIIWMTSFVRFSSNPWILVTELRFNLWCTYCHCFWKLENGSPSPKRLSLTLKRPATCVEKPPQWFDRLMSEEDFQCAKGVILLNTKSSSKWALHDLHDWMDSWNSNSNENVPEDILSCPDAEVVCKWLCLFVQETRKENGKQYPPATIRCLLSTYQREVQDDKQRKWRRRRQWRSRYEMSPRTIGHTLIVTQRENGGHRIFVDLPSVHFTALRRLPECRNHRRSRIHSELPLESAQEPCMAVIFLSASESRFPLIS